MTAARPRSPGVTILRGPDPFPPELPLALQVEFTSRCNLRCRMCPLTTGTSSSSGSPGPMSDVVFDELLQIARRCRQVILAGYGEPLTNPQCLPMLRALDAEGINVGMATNGLALSPALARELVALPHLTLVNVSIDSPDPVVYRAVRGGNVHRALQGLRNLMAAVDDPDRVMVSSVAMQSTLPSLVAFPPLLAGLGVRRYSLQAVLDYNDYAQDQGLLGHAEHAALLEDIEAACTANGVELELSVPDRSRADLSDPGWAREHFYGNVSWDERLTRRCRVPWDVPFVDKDGRVFACCFAASADERQLGQLGPQTFDEIWTGSAFQRFRRDLVDGRTTPSICRRCSVAPLGEHFYRTWRATVVSGLVGETDRATSSAVVSVAARNDGVRTWTSADHVRLGTASPRDSTSPLEHASWFAPQRPVTYLGPDVRTGDVATFEFTVTAPAGAVTTAEFALVAEGAAWLPNTTFAVTVRGARLPPHRSLARALQKRQGPVARAGRRALPGGVRARLRRLAAGG